MPFRNTHKIKSILKSIKYLINRNQLIDIQSQSWGEESQFLRKCSKYLENKSFIEFGFAIDEFNSISLINKNFQGLLIDTWRSQAILFNLIAKLNHWNSKAISRFLEIDNLEPLKYFIKKNNGLGVLSVDIDGNDYWILKEIIKTNEPEVIIVEYNASFLGQSITIPYQKSFDVSKQNPGGIYHGASLMAFYNLLSKKGYDLVGNASGVNLFFTKNVLTKKMNLKSYRGMEIYKENIFRNAGNAWSGTNASEQWSTIQNLDYVQV